MMLFVVVVVMLTVVAAATMMFFMLLLQLFQLCCQRGLALHGLQQLRTGQFMPRRNHQRGFRIMLPQKGYSGIQLGLGNGIRTGKDDGRGGFDLIVVEFAKILHIDLYLACIGNSHSIAQNHIIICHLLDRRHNIAELTNTGRLNHNALRCIFGDHFLQCLSKITHQTAANATRVHFGDVDTGILQEATVNADLAKFVFDQHQLLACIGLLNHFLDQRGLAGTKETGININLCHEIFSFAYFYLFYHI